MAYVITDNCVKDELCIQACPVDAIHPRGDEGEFEAASQMFVDPAGCIDCGACEPVCPVKAIFAEDEVPANWKNFIELNKQFFKDNPGVKPATKS